MTTTAATPAPSKAARVTGWILTVLPSLLLTMSGVMKLAMSASEKNGFAELGWPAGAAIPIGVTELLCTALYLIPRTSVLGAVLLTGYLGGAVATHARLEQGVFIAPAIMGAVLWLGLYFREPRLRALLPLRS